MPSIFGKSFSYIQENCWICATFLMIGLHFHRYPNIVTALSPHHTMSLTYVILEYGKQQTCYMYQADLKSQSLGLKL